MNEIDLGDKKESVKAPPRIIGILGILPPDKSDFPKLLANALGLELVAGDVYGDSGASAFKRHVKSFTDRTSGIQRYLGQDCVVVYPSFEMSRLNFEEAHRVGELEKNDFELLQHLYLTLEGIGAIRAPDITIFVDPKDRSPELKNLRASIRKHLINDLRGNVLYFGIGRENSLGEKSIGKIAKLIRKKLKSLP